MNMNIGITENVFCNDIYGWHSQATKNIVKAVGTCGTSFFEYGEHNLNNAGNALTNNKWL